MKLDEFTTAASDYAVSIDHIFWLLVTISAVIVLVIVAMLVTFMARYRKGSPALRGELPEFTCLVGTMVQEVYETHPAIREACEKSISNHAATLEPMIAEAMSKYGVDESQWSARSLALYTQAVIQGAFVLAKAKGGPEVASESLDHLRRYLTMLFIPTGISTQ